MPKPSRNAIERKTPKATNRKNIGSKIKIVNEVPKAGKLGEFVRTPNGKLWTYTVMGWIEVYRKKNVKKETK